MEGGALEVDRRGKKKKKKKADRNSQIKREKRAMVRAPSPMT